MINDSVFPIKSGTEWTFEQIHQTYQVLEKLATDKYKLDTYPNQIEMVTSEQMLDAYASVGMPIMYKHWSFGKSFIQSHKEYVNGNQSLAYEMVINSNPCINYLMEENTAMMQTLVMAHAAFGHNWVFKNNYLFKQWTDADGIIDYLMYANDFIQSCEERYGMEEVEHILDVAHAWQYYGVDKYKRPPKLTGEGERLKQVEFEEYEQKTYDYVMERTLKNVRFESNAGPSTDRGYCEGEQEFEPQENILYFIEKNAPNMPQWKREIIRIVRKLAQYFYPQIQTKVLNEGMATFMHYHLIHDLREGGYVDEGFMLEFYDSHTGVVAQRSMSGSLNPYALGFAILMDIKRISTEPTQEDRDWFGTQSWVGNGNWIENVKWACANFKDESFVRQFLSPKVMKDFKMFVVENDSDEDFLLVTDIHDAAGFTNIRNKLADNYLWTKHFPDIQVTYYDKDGDRTLYLTYTGHDGQILHEDMLFQVGTYLASIWGYPIEIDSVAADANNGLQLTQSVRICESDDVDGSYEISVRKLSYDDDMG